MELCETLITAHANEPGLEPSTEISLFRSQLDKALEQYKIILEADKSSYNVWNQVLPPGEAELQHYQNIRPEQEAMEAFSHISKTFSYSTV